MQYQRRTPADAIAQMETCQPPPDHPIMKYSFTSDYHAATQPPPRL